MNIIPFVHEGLGNSSYLVDVGDGRALLVDPDRSVDRYLAMARHLGLEIHAVLETHLHADFISGARELSVAEGARCFMPAGADARFDHIAVTDGQPVEIEGMRIDAIHTPGHTPEHMSYVVRGQAGPPVLFSGGSLIVGGAARTDLIAPEQTGALTREQYRSVRSRLAALPDQTGLYPTHGAGSFCSTGSGGERTSTLGTERSTNPVLASSSEDEFVEWFPATFPAAPAYFFKLRPINQAGPRVRKDVPAPPALPPVLFDEMREGATVVDVRPMDQFTTGHIAGSVSNALRDSFATWLGWLLPLHTPLLFVANDEHIDETVDQAMLVGFEHFAGYLDGGIDAWEAAGLPLESSALVDAARARSLLADGGAAIDVREPAEYADGHIPGALHVPLGQLRDRLEAIPSGRPLVVYCGHGERAATGLSLLSSAGFRELANLDGGMGAWNAAGLPMEHV